MSLVFACIAPHGDVDLDPTLRPAMEELGRRAAAAQPDVAVVVTPHSVHVEGHYAVVTSAKLRPARRFTRTLQRRAGTAHSLRRSRADSASTPQYLPGCFQIEIKRKLVPGV